MLLAEHCLVGGAPFVNGGQVPSKKAIEGIGGGIADVRVVLPDTFLQIVEEVVVVELLRGLRRPEEHIAIVGDLPAEPHAQGNAEDGGVDAAALTAESGLLVDVSYVPLFAVKELAEILPLWVQGDDRLIDLV